MQPNGLPKDKSRLAAMYVRHPAIARRLMQEHRAEQVAKERASKQADKKGGAK